MIKKYYVGLLVLLLVPGISFAKGHAARSTATNTTTSAAQTSADDTTPAVTTTTTTVENAPRQFNPQDPYEPFNRVMYHFNDFVDNAVLKPVATLYNKIVPKPLIKGISNIFYNIDTIPTVANDVLQGNFYQATSDTWRIAINTTIGIGGFFDVASDLGLERNSEDLGLTFARWGWKSSDYLVLPFIGPSTVRDGVAWPINYQLFTVYPYVHPLGTRYAIYAVSVVSKRAEILRFQNVMEQAALDRYVFLRNAYMQNRNYKIEQNEQRNDPYLEKNAEANKAKLYT